MADISSVPSALRTRVSEVCELRGLDFAEMCKGETAKAQATRSSVIRILWQHNLRPQQIAFALNMAHEAVLSVMGIATPERKNKRASSDLIEGVMQDEIFHHTRRKKRP